MLLFFGRGALGRGGLVWLASLSLLNSASRLTTSWFRQPTCRLASLTWQTAPTDEFLVVKFWRLTALPGIVWWSVRPRESCGCLGCGRRSFVI